ncbi:phage tail tube protein [Symbiobacterium terraclitae]|uniref:phage tail tube protein n=1 Tax=Symbiobacterium terraclitae TaxID=557451 RepID=UPI0035B565D2
MGFLHAPDVISGKEGRAYAVINGNVEELFYAKNIEARVEKTKSEIKALGRRATQHKTTGWTGTGTMTLYYVSPVFRRMMLEYARTGRDIYFTLQVINEDPASATGKQTAVLKEVNIDSVILAKVDIDADELDEEVPFTFSDFDLPDQFNELRG